MGLERVESGRIRRIGTELLVIFLLILANGVFAMSEIAVVAARKVRLQQRAEEGDERARAALALAHDPNKFLSTVQFGITLVGVLAGAYGGARLAEPLAEPIAPMSRCWRRTPKASRSALVVTGITVLSLIFGELVPKRIGLNNPEAIASWVARPMMVLSRIGGPVVALLTASTNLVLRVFGIKGEAEPNLTEDEIKALISQGAETGAVGATEENIVQRVFQLGDQRVVGDHDAAARHRVDRRRRRRKRSCASSSPRTRTRSSWCATAASTKCSASCARRICCRWRSRACASSCAR